MKDWIPTTVLLGICALLMYLLLSTQGTFVKVMNQQAEHVGLMHALVNKYMDATDRQGNEIEAWHKRQWKENKSGNPKEGGKK